VDVRIQLARRAEKNSTNAGETSMSNVDLVFNPNVATVGARTDVADAAKLMRDQHVGDLIVTEPRNGHAVPIGILTDRDIVVGVIAKRIELDAVTVGDVMSRNVVTVREDASLEFALREMRRHGVRRAPVVRADGGLVGVIAFDDIVQHLAVQLSRLSDLTRLEQDAETNARP
jgi:CBS domain-containing protein